MACDFVDLVQNGFGTRPVVPLQGLFEHHFATSTTVSRLNINPPNSFLGFQRGDRDTESSRLLSGSRWELGITTLMGNEVKNPPHKARLQS